MVTEKFTNDKRAVSFVFELIYLLAENGLNFHENFILLRVGLSASLVKKAEC